MTLRLWQPQRCRPGVPNLKESAAFNGRVWLCGCGARWELRRDPYEQLGADPRWLYCVACGLYEDGHAKETLTASG